MRKIPTLFVRDPATKLRYLTRDVHPDCQWVADGEGVATRKYDGQCVTLDSEGVFYKRREIKRGKTPPTGFVEEDHDEATGKRVGWVLVDPLDPADRYLMQAYGQTIIATDDVTTLYGATYEAVGPKIQGNAERRDVHVLIRHDDAEGLPDAPRDYDGLAGFLAEFDGEGIVWHHPDGRMAKIKRRDFPKAG